MRKAKGFTLIELMIVVAIIAILAAVAIPNFMTARDRAKRSAAESTLGNLRKAFEIYISDSDSSEYPAEIGQNTITEKNGQFNGTGAAEFIAAIGKYTKVTGMLEKAVYNGALNLDIDPKGSRYTLSVQASDRTPRSILTATPENIDCTKNGKPC